MTEMKSFAVVADQGADFGNPNLRDFFDQPLHPLRLFHRRNSQVNMRCRAWLTPGLTDQDLGAFGVYGNHFTQAYRPFPIQ